MSVIIAAELQAGIIFGDHSTKEYIYLPGGEIGMSQPMCILETPKSRQDLYLEEAVEMVLRLSLKPVRHPRIGLRSC